MEGKGNLALRTISAQHPTRQFPQALAANMAFSSRRASRERPQRRLRRSIWRSRLVRRRLL